MLLVLNNGPAKAQGTIPPEYNTMGVLSSELPVPLPVSPGAVSLPEISFPEVTNNSWPSLIAQKSNLESAAHERVVNIRYNLNSQYNATRNALNEVRVTTDMISNAVGDPTSVAVNTGTSALNATQIAQQMSSSMSYATGYLRAITTVGPLGLDLAFVFIGLGWIVFVNLVTLLIRLMFWFIHIMWEIMLAAYYLIDSVSEVANLIISAVDLLWPF